MLMSVSLSASDSHASENHAATSGRGEFVLSRTGSTAAPLTVSLAVSDASTADASDYTALPQTVVIPAHKSKVDIYLTPTQQPLAVQNESVIWTLVSDPAYTINPSRAAATVTITDGEATLSIKADHPNASETKPTTSGKGSFQISRTGGSTSSALTVNYTIDPSSTATNGVDYATLTGTIVIPKGKSSVEVPVIPVDDPYLEPTETVNLQLAVGAYHLNAAKSAATVFIKDNDPNGQPQPSVPEYHISLASNASESGSGNSGQFLVTRDGPTTDAATVTYSILPSSTAQGGVDYQLLSGSVVIPVGTASATINVLPIDQNIVGGSKTVVVQLTNSTITDSTITATLAIADNDTAPVTPPVVTTPDVSISALSNASETDPTGTGKGQFLFTRTGSTDSALTVNYAVYSGSTASTADYQPLGTVVIPAGQSTATLDVIPVDDNLVEGTETLTLVLTTTTETDPSHTMATMTIADNDSTPPLIPNVTIAASANASETNPSTTGQGLFTVTRTGDLTDALTVSYAISSSSTAVAGTDYTALPGTVTIPAGQASATISVTPIDDTIYEGTRTLGVTLSNSSANPSQISATLTIADNDPNLVGTERFDVPLDINSGSYPRTDYVIEEPVNFTTALSAAGQSAPLVESSIRVEELSADSQTVIDSNVPFQFDHTDSYDAATNASGTLDVLMSGNTAANTTRHYVVLFDNTGTYTPSSPTPLVTVDQNSSDQDMDAIKITSENSTYYLQKANGGFSTILDADGNNWLGYNDTPGSESAGEYRGLPNGIFHPGSAHGGVVTVISTGPLKSSIQVADTAGTIRYDFYPTFTRATVVSTTSPYWFLYEGTPGGSLDANDYTVRSDGTVTSAQASWEEDSGIGTGTNNGQWAYFGDGTTNRYLYMIQDTPDTLQDSYFDLDDNMTVFGFGRERVPGGDDVQLMTNSNTFTFGLADGGDNFAASSQLINGTYRPTTLTASAVQTIH